MPVSKDQFDVIDDFTVRHRPTGMTISTYRYMDSAKVGDMWIKDHRKDEDFPEFTDTEIRQVAVELLKELQTGKP